MAERSDTQGEDAYGAFRAFHVRVLLALTVVAALLRLFRLGDWSFWVDEAHTFRDATSPADEFWRSNVSNYPLGYLLLRGMLGTGLVPATNEGWLRLPFAFFGIVSIPMLAVLGRALVGRRAAILAAAFLTLSPWHIYWSQNARGYAPELLFSMIGIFALYHTSRERSVLLGACSLICIAIAGAWHPSGLAGMVVLLAFLSIELTFQPELRARLFRPPSVLLAAVLLVGLGIWLLPTLKTAIVNKPEFSLVHLVQTFAWFLRPEFVAASLAGLLLMILRAGRRETALLASWGIAPFVVLILLGSTVMKVTAQYGLLILPPALLLTARLIVEIADAVREVGLIPRLLRWSLPTILLASLCSEDFFYYFQRSGDRPRFREAATYLRNARQGPLTVYTSNIPSMTYYLDRRAFYGSADRDTEVLGFSKKDMRDAGGGARFFDKVVADAQQAQRELWVVITAPELAEWDMDGGFDVSLRNHAFQVERLPCWLGPKDMTVLVYRVPGTPR
ncbi:MAG: hypothetical protein U1F36_07660 [Planctomycetota bacterium]